MSLHILFIQGGKKEIHQQRIIFATKKSLSHGATVLKLFYAFDYIFFHALKMIKYHYVN